MTGKSRAPARARRPSLKLLNNRTTAALLRELRGPFRRAARDLILNGGALPRQTVDRLDTLIGALMPSGDPPARPARDLSDEAIGWGTERGEVAYLLGVVVGQLLSPGFLLTVEPRGRRHA